MEAWGSRFCLDRVLIETLDLDTGREPVSTVEKISTLSKSKSRRSRSRNLSRHEIFGKSRQFVSISINFITFLDRDI
jgi:hypothetical protein